MSTGLKFAIVFLVAAVLGLGVALAVVASDDSDDETTTSSSTSSTTTALFHDSSTTEPTTTSTTATTTAPPDDDPIDDDQHGDDLDLDDVDRHRPRDDHRGRRAAEGPSARAALRVLPDPLARVEDADLGQLREHGPALGGAVERVAGGEHEPLVADVVDDLDLVGSTISCFSTV